jgi:tetratricopeptide (TPR) repeat protein
LAVALKIAEQQDPPDMRKAALVKLSIAGLHTEVYDYNSAMRYLAEAVELLSDSGALKPADDSDLSASFVSLMQQAQLFSSAHELVSQAIELEESDRLEQANYFYDNSLILLEQIFSEESLEIAQVLRFKAAVLKKLGRSKEAKATDIRANRIEDEITEKFRALERFRQSLPSVVVNVLHA